MFVKMFEQIFDSSIAEDYLVRLVFEDFLKLADSRGVVDRTPESISRRTNVPLDIITRAISILSAPDLKSRSPEEEGRRIILLDEHRDWGWRVVNYETYRAVRNEDDRREQNRKAQERFRSKHSKPISNAHNAYGKGLSCTSAQAEAEAEACIPVFSLEPVSSSDLAKTPNCATSKNVARYTDERFNAWWGEYWLHKGKGKAQKAFGKHVTSEASFERIMAATKAQKPEMLLREPEYRPYGATWLNGERWEDEISAPQPASSRESIELNGLKQRMNEDRKLLGLKELE